MFPQLARFTSLGLLLMRLMVGLIFVTSGYNHLKSPTERAKSIGMSKPFTIFLGMAEVAGGLGVAKLPVPGHNGSAAAVLPSYRKADRPGLAAGRRR